MDEREERVENPQHGGNTAKQNKKAPTQDCRRTRGYKDGFESHTAV